MRGFLVVPLCLMMGLCLAWQGGPAWGQDSLGKPGKPALYEFGACYCVSCREMEKIMGELREQYGEQFEVRLVYAGKEDDLFKRYRIMLIPTQVFLDAQGKEVDRHIGALSKEQVLEKLKALKFIGQ